jgi:hypothetical protein
VNSALLDRKMSFPANVFVASIMLSLPSPLQPVVWFIHVLTFVSFVDMQNLTCTSLPTFKTSSRVDIFCVCSNLPAFKLYPCGMKGYMKAWKGTILTA